MKIVLIGKYNFSENLSGPEKFAKRMFENGCKSEIEVVFIDYFRGGDHGFIKKLFGLELSTDSECKIVRLGLLSCIHYFFRTRPNIIHIVTFELFTIMSFLYKLFTKVKIFYTVHGIVRYENRFNKKNYKLYYLIKDDIVEKLLFRFSDKIIFVSAILKNFAVNFYDLSAKDTYHIIPNGFDSLSFQIVNRKLNYENPLRLLLVGDLDRLEKGFSTFFIALKEINFPTEVSIISDVNFAIELSDFGKADVKIFKKMNTLKYYDFLLKHDIYISNSSYEPFQIVLVEAMSAGLLPIVSDATGASYLVKNGFNGYIYKTGDFMELTHILNEVNENREIIYNSSKIIKDSIKNLSWENVFSMYSEVYIKITNGYE